MRNSRTFALVQKQPSIAGLARQLAYCCVYLLAILPARGQSCCPVAYSQAAGNALSLTISHDTVFATDGIIQSLQIIDLPGQVTYDAGVSIELMSGFEAKPGSVFTALIDGCDSIHDVTAQLELLGNPPVLDGVSGKGRNIWDVQSHQGKIYIGFGSTVQNTGPTTLFAYDPISDSLLQECTLQAEAIERFRVFNDTLFVPNSDPKGGDQLKFSIVVDGDCTDVTLHHNFAHVRDMYLFDGRYYLVGNSRCPKMYDPSCAGLIALDHWGQSYQDSLLHPLLSAVDPYMNMRWNWFFGMLEVGDALVIPNAMFTERYNGNLTIKDNLFYHIDDDSLHWSALEPESTRLKHHHFYPALPATPGTDDTLGLQTSLRPFAQLNSQGKTLYTLRTYSMFSGLYQSAYNNSRGLMIKDSLRSSALPVTLPESKAVGEDLLQINDEVFVLANMKVAQDEFWVYVYRSTDPQAAPTAWKEVMRFSSSNMARSFEFYDGHFYFGLGQNDWDDLNNAGQLLRVDCR